ncbi:UBX domain-containing protein [Histoplasma capsulatum var. duboisii H88]|uniref:UBX domain-containing protein 2 n=2 Tax=Ajellomyces capsulatus (strain H88) TaxID=544711 RepID=A0A8A1LKK9_AJEC8|nr:UBX domain-containing protein [Histoplasma capsulatum var. duboisii H88]
MFYAGDLQGGIALAVSEAKHVICFVRDDTNESLKWENEYLASEEIATLVKSKTVSLRLQAGSVEAGYLASFCSISKIPALVVIKNGVVREYIMSGVSAEDFKRRLKKGLGDSPAPTPQLAPQPSQIESNSSPGVITPVSSGPLSTHTPDQDSESTEEQWQGASERQRSESIRAGKRRAETIEEPENDQKAPPSQTQSWLLEQRKREQQKKEERNRILNQIKRDAEDRKAREESRKESFVSSTNNENNTPKTGNKQPQAKFKPNQFRLQIRLFDGSSVRSSFSPTQTIQNDVRPWLDSQRSDGDTPYNLKQILTPLPSRTISVAEENQTLEELGLGPTANLVMVPVRTYTEAYASAEASLPVRGLYAAYNLVTGTAGAVAGAIGSILGISLHPAANTGSAAAEPPSAAEGPSRANFRGGRNGRSNVRTLHDGDDEGEGRQFYNGNQLNFEPRTDQENE